MSATPTAFIDAEAALREALGGLDGWLADWWLPVTLGALMLEGIPVAGFVAPGLVLLVFAGFKAAAEPAHWAALVFLACFAALVAGDFIAFGLGRWARSRSERMQHWFENRLPNSDRWRQAAFWTLVVYQFPPYARMIVPALLGSANMSLRSWTAACFAASLLFTAVAFGAGYLGGHVGGDFVTANQQLANLVGILSIAFLLAAGSLTARLWHKRGGGPARDG